MVTRDNQNYMYIDHNFYYKSDIHIVLHFISILEVYQSYIEIIFIAYFTNILSFWCNFCKIDRKT